MKKNIKKAVYFMTATSLVLPTVSMAASAGSEGAVAKQTVKSQATNLALDQSASTLLSLIIATSKVEQSAGQLVAIDPQVAKKYTYLRTAYLGAVPTSGLTLGAGSLGVESVKKVEFVLAPLTALLRALQMMGKMSIDGVEKFSEVTGLDKVIEKSIDSSSKSAELAYDNLIKPVLAVLINRHTALSSATSSASSIAAGSIFLMMNDSKEAMTLSQVRNVLGQDQVIRTRIDAAVKGIADIYNLNADQQAQLKVAIYDDIIKQAVENKFSDDMSKYQLDILKLMSEKRIVDEATVSAVMKVRSVVNQLTATSTSSDTARGLAIANTDLALQLAALLESQLNNSKLQNPAVKGEIERMLGSVSAKLALIGFNLQK